MVTKQVARSKPGGKIGNDVSTKVPTMFAIWWVSDIMRVGNKLNTKNHIGSNATTHRNSLILGAGFCTNPGQ